METRFFENFNISIPIEECIVNYWDNITGLHEDLKDDKEKAQQRFFKRVNRLIDHHSTTNHDLIRFALDNNFDEFIQDYEIAFTNYCLLKREEWEEEFYRSREIYNYIAATYDVNFSVLLHEFYRRQAEKLARVLDRVKKINTLVCGRNKAYFYTLTLDEKKLAKKGIYGSITANGTSKETYQKIRFYIRKYIANYCPYYVFNKDFGLNETKRLHFHGVGLMCDGELDSFKKYYKEEFAQILDIQEINKRNDLLSQYINKLTKHAMKVNYGYNRENFIWSRIKD